MTATATKSATRRVAREDRHDATGTVTMARSVLADALAQIGLVATVAAARQLPVLQSVRIAPDGDGLRLTGTDLDRAVSLTIPADGAASFPVRVVPCHRLAAIVGQLPDGVLTVEATAASRGIRVSAGRARLDLAGMAADEFPAVDAGMNDDVARAVASLAIDGPLFVRALTRCRPFVRTEGGFGALFGVHVKALENGRIEIEATDGHQMTRDWIERPTGPALDLIVSTASVATIAKLFAGAEALTVMLTERRAIVASEDRTVRFATNLLEGPFANTAPIFTAASPHTATVDRSALLTATRRAAVVSTNAQYHIRLTWHADHVVVSGVGDEEVGRAEEIVPCDVPTLRAGSLRITFAPQLLVSALAIRTTDTVHVGLNTGERAMTLRDDGTTEVQNVVMPIRDRDP